MEWARGVFAIGAIGRLFKFLQLLFKVVVESDTFDDGRVGFLELIAVETNKYSLDVVDELVNP